MQTKLLLLLTCAWRPPQDEVAESESNQVKPESNRLLPHMHILKYASDIVRLPLKHKT